jgi:hypothetical protein
MHKGTQAWHQVIDTYKVHPPYVQNRMWPKRISLPLDLALDLLVSTPNDPWHSEYRIDVVDNRYVITQWPFEGEAIINYTKGASIILE